MMYEPSVHISRVCKIATIFVDAGVKLGGVIWIIF